MPKPNVHGLPQHLRKDKKGYFLDYFMQEGDCGNEEGSGWARYHSSKPKKILAKHMQDIVEGKFLADEKRETNFNEAADSFLAYSLARRSSHANDLQITKRLKSYFGNRPLRSINPDIVEGYLTQRRKVGNQLRIGKALANATLNRDLALLKCITRRAVLNGLLDRNPIEGVRGFKEESRDRTLTQEEYEALLRRCSPRLKAIVQLAGRA